MNIVTYTVFLFKYAMTNQAPIAIITMPAVSDTHKGGLIGNMLYPMAMTAIPKAIAERLVLVFTNLFHFSLLGISTS
jgi:hypothetical protein